MSIVAQFTIVRTWEQPNCPLTDEWVQKIHAAAAAKLLQSCPTLCDPTDSSPPGSPVPGILQARTLESSAILLHRGYIYTHTYTRIYAHTHTHTYAYINEYYSDITSTVTYCTRLCNLIFFFSMLFL